MDTIKKKPGRSIQNATTRTQPYHLCKDNEWYSREDIITKLYDLNPLYILSKQTFFYWIRQLYKGSFKKIGLITLYQGKYINPVIDTLIAFKSPRRQDE